MRKITLLFLLFNIGFTLGQNSIRTVNSGSIIAPNSVVSIGEIVVNPVNPQASSSSGIIGILSQVNLQLEVSEFEISKNVIVFPNPTIAKLYFKSDETIKNENVSIFNNSGQLVMQTKINEENSIDLQELSSGIYLIQFTNKSLKSFKIIKK